MFSFSSCSDMLGAGLALICLILDCGKSEDETRRGTDDPEPSFEELGRVYEETRGAGVGVSAIEERGFRGGGPIDPSTTLDLDVEVPFARTLLLRTGALDEVDVSSDILRSLVVLLALEMTEDGRETVGVLKTVESRRVVRAGCEGVAPAVPRTPLCLFI